MLNVAEATFLLPRFPQIGQKSRIAGDSVAESSHICPGCLRSAKCPTVTAR